MCEFFQGSARTGVPGPIPGPGAGHLLIAFESSGASLWDEALGAAQLHYSYFYVSKSFVSVFNSSRANNRYDALINTHTSTTFHANNGLF